MKKIVLDDVELEYNIFQTLNKETETDMNSIENNIILIHGGIMADSNIPLVPFFDILIKAIIYYIIIEVDMEKALTKKMTIVVYYNMQKIVKKYWIFLISRELTS